MQLHGLWLPGKWPSLFIWAQQDKRRRVSAPARGALYYPWAVAPQFLSPYAPKGSQHGTAIMALPMQTNQGLQLETWRMQGLLLDPDAAMPWLLAASEQQLGDDLRVLRKAARLTLELLLRERYVPGVIAPMSEGDQTWAVWRLLWTEPEDQSRLNTLATALPLSGRCLTSDKKGTVFQPQDGLHLVQDFTRVCAHALLRLWLADRPSPPRPREGRHPLTTWLGGLRSGPKTLRLTAVEGTQLSALVSQWTRPLTLPPQPPFRTCFRLSPPPPPKPPAPPVDQDAATVVAATAEEPARPDTTDEPWRLEVLLQATDETSLLVSAGTLWAGGEEGRLLRERLKRPEPQLDLDLEIAARLVPALSKARKERQAAIPLTLPEAYEFLTQGAAQLQEAGFHVLLPTWWTRSTAAIRLKGQAKSSRKASGGAVGLAELVDIDWEAALGDQAIRPEDLARLASLKVPLVRLKGRWVEVNPQAVKTALKHLEAKPMSVANSLRLAAANTRTEPGLQVDPLTAGDGWLMELFSLLRGERTLQELPPPPTLQTDLRPYQRRGFSWLVFLTDHRLGACLADDMGLGKSVQLISLLLHRRHQRKRQHAPTLLVCPTSVVGNWQRELSRFAPELRVLVHHGAGRTQGDELAATVQTADVVLSTYTVAGRDAAALQSVAWDGVVLDEAQNIKNHDTHQARVLRRLQSAYRVALTGTPVENRLGELWAIMDFLNPGYLGSETEFHSKFTVPIERQQDPAAADYLRRLIQPFVLRRLKSDPRIAPDLPPKQEQTVYVTLTPEQATLYEAVMQDTLIQIDEATGMQRRGLVLAALSKLKQICDHPSLFLHDKSPLGDRSGKALRLQEMLEEVVAEGQKALVFTQFAEMALRLRDHLAAHLGREVLCLHGGVPAASRTKMVKRFQEEPDGPPIFILSLKAGGVGINLTAATHVFHFDRWWNPAVENQATDRAYRLGQQETVLVHRLICAGTLEEKIDQLLASKRLLAEQVVGSSDEWVTELSTEQLRTLFALEV